MINPKFQSFSCKNPGCKARPQSQAAKGGCKGRPQSQAEGPVRVLLCSQYFLDINSQPFILIFFILDLWYPIYFSLYSFLYHKILNFFNLLISICASFWVLFNSSLVKKIKIDFLATGMLCTFKWKLKTCTIHF